MGNDLALARQRVGASLEDAASALRIRLPYLRALEEGRPEDLPGGAYALAFLRSYATALGLDADEAVRRYKAENARACAAPELEFPQPAAHGTVPLGAAALVAVVLAIGAYAGWYHLSGEGRLPAETVPPVPARLADLAAPPAAIAVPQPAPAAQQTAAITQTVPPPAPAAVPLAAPPSDSPSGTVYPTQAAAAPMPPPALAKSLVVKAVADAWVQVRDPAGHVVFSQLMHAGDSWTAPSEPGLTMITGNAGGTEIVGGGVSTGPLGAPGAVRRGIALDPASLANAAQAAVAR